MSSGQARGRIVDRFIQTEWSFEPRRNESLQIQARLLGRHHQRERRGLGCNDYIIGKPAFTRYPGYHQACHDETTTLVEVIGRGTVRLTA